ncbi:hypothetical protein [Basfia succiniciproducens]|uniref:hypothetical protein n=1 Tax=Basfia succiniciproducens TaxID=653940 RepID=UPI003FCCFDCF
MADYGIKIGNTEITKFTMARSNTYGLTNGSKEIDIAKLGIITKTETYSKKVFYEDMSKLGTFKNVPTNAWWRPNTGASITYNPYASGSNGAIYVTGTVVTIGTQFNRTSDYGIYVNGAYLSTADVLIKQSATITMNATTVKANASGNITVSNCYFNLSALITNAWNKVNKGSTHEDSDFTFIYNGGKLYFTGLAYELNQNGMAITLDSYI